MRRLITLLVAATVAILGGALAATPALAQDVDPGTRTIVLEPDFVAGLTANNVTVAASDGAVVDDSDGQLSVTFPVTGDPTDGVVELGGTLIMSNPGSTVSMSDMIIDTTTGVVSADAGGRLDLFTVAPSGTDGTWVIALNDLSAFGVNITFGTSFASGQEFGTVEL